MITKITISMTEFTEHYPTGAIAYEGDVVVDSDFCETTEDFQDFINYLREEITPATVLEVAFDTRDLVFNPDVTEAMMKIVRDVSNWFYDKYGWKGVTP